MFNRILLAVVSFILTATCVACVNHLGLSETPIREIIAKPVDFDGAMVKVKGYIRWQGVGGPLLYATRSAALNAPEDQGIDLARAKGHFNSVAHYLSGNQGQCMILVGHFRAYTKDLILLDTTSKYGEITATEVSHC